MSIPTPTHIDPRHSRAWMRAEDLAEQRRLADLARAGRHEEVIANLRRDMDVMRHRAAARLGGYYDAVAKGDAY